MEFILEIKKLHPDAKIPERAHRTDAGLDFFALEPVIIRPGEIVKCRTGIAVSSVLDGYAMPEYQRAFTTVGLVMDKSGLGSKGLKVFGGVIDDAYTGEVIIVLGNFNPEVVQKKFDFLAETHRETDGTITIQKGGKLAQLLITTVQLPELIVVEEFSREVDRGISGFWSTGS